MTQEKLSIRQNIGRHYRLVALDLDGTVLLKNRPISERVLNTVRMVCARGIYVTLVSGRTFSSALPYALELAINAPLICYGGALIRDPVTGDELYHQKIPLSLAREVIQVGRRMGLPVNVYLDDQIYVDEVSPNSPAYEALLRMKARPVGDLLSFLDREPTYLALVCEQEQTKQRVLQLRALFGGRLNVTSGHPLLAEVCHPSVSKGKALARLADLLNVQREEVLAVGNDWNDIDMLTYAGLGVAMHGSPVEVLAVADAVAPPAMEDGVATVLEEFVLV